MPTDPSGTSLDKTLRDFVPDQKVFGRYRLIRILGRGGMGIVWLAHDEQLDREAALKFLPEIIVHDRGVIEDLKRETKRCLELTHKNIVRIHDFIQDNVSACISMEYIDGDTLSNLRADKATRIFEPDEIKPWLSQLCEALDYAHNHARIIHRDLKPSNLMISRRGVLKIADFGIARSLTDSVSMLTHSTGTSGTLVYMSPQQLDGMRATHLDDIYSIGATIYELLTSKPPFYSGDINRQIHERIPPPMMQRRADLDIEGNPIPKAWEDTIAACLAKDPGKRPQNVLDITKAVTGAIDIRHGISPGFIPPLRTRLSRLGLTKLSRKFVLIAAALALATAAFWWFGVEQPRRIANRKLVEAQEAAQRLEQDMAEAKRRADAAEAERKAEEARNAAAAEELRKQQEAAEAKRRADAAETERKAEEARKAEAAEQLRKEQEAAEAKRCADAAEAERKAEEARKAAASTHLFAGTWIGSAHSEGNAQGVGNSSSDDSVTVQIDAYEKSVIITLGSAREVHAAFKQGRSLSWSESASLNTIYGPSTTQLHGSLVANDDGNTAVFTQTQEVRPNGGQPAARGTQSGTLTKIN